MYTAKLGISKFKLEGIENQSLFVDRGTITYKAEKVSLGYKWKATTSILNTSGSGTVSLTYLSAKLTPTTSGNGKVQFDDPIVQFEDLNNDLGNFALNFLADQLLTDLKSKAQHLTRTSLSQYRVKALKLLNLTSDIDVGKISFKFFDGFLKPRANGLVLVFQVQILQDNKVLVDGGDVESVSLAETQNSFKIALSDDVAKVFDGRQVTSFPLKIIDFSTFSKTTGGQVYTVAGCVAPKSKTKDDKRKTDL